MSGLRLPLTLGQRVAVWALEPRSVSRGHVLPAVSLSLCHLWTLVGTVMFDLFPTSSFLFLGLQEALGPGLHSLLRGLTVSPAHPPTRAGAADKITDQVGVALRNGGGATAAPLPSFSSSGCGIRTSGALVGSVPVCTDLCAWPRSLCAGQDSCVTCNPRLIGHCRQSWLDRVTAA